MVAFCRAVLTIALMLLIPFALAEEGFRDFYAEPGHRPENLVPSDDPSESIDLFSGNVQRQYVDLSIPGNGGLDIDVRRFYNLPQSAPSFQNPYGYGWTMHFGRISAPSGAQMLCDMGPIANGDTKNNPTIEFPTGGRELLVHSKRLGDGTFITQSNWKVECVNPLDYQDGLIAFAPDGTRYFMRERAFIQGEEGPAGQSAPIVETFLTDRIEDTYGNWLSFTYLELQNGMKILTQIDAKDLRTVTYSYENASGQPASGADINVRLAEISANGQVWKYHHQTSVAGAGDGWGAVQQYQLSAVERPDGEQWSYEYGTGAGSASVGRLTRVVTPSGGEVNYTHQWIQPYLPNPDFRISAIQSKQKSTPGGASGTWTYQFNPGAVDISTLHSTWSGQSGRMVDETVVTTPDGSEKAYHIGYWASVGRNGSLFQIGHRVKHDLFNGSDTSPVRSEIHASTYRVISDQVFKSGLLTALSDSEVRIVTNRYTLVVVDGAQTYESYRHDVFGNLTTLWERRTLWRDGDDSRYTLYDYINDTTNWFIGLREQDYITENFATAGFIDRTFNSHGKLASETVLGVTTDYTYT